MLLVFVVESSVVFIIGARSYVEFTIRVLLSSYNHTSLVLRRSEGGAQEKNA